MYGLYDFLTIFGKSSFIASGIIYGIGLAFRCVYGLDGHAFLGYMGGGRQEDGCMG